MSILCYTVRESRDDTHIAADGHRQLSSVKVGISVSLTVTATLDTYQHWHTWHQTTANDRGNKQEFSVTLPSNSSSSSNNNNTMSDSVNFNVRTVTLWTENTRSY